MLQDEKNVNSILGILETQKTPRAVFSVISVINLYYMELLH